MLPPASLGPGVRVSCNSIALLAASMVPRTTVCWDTIGVKAWVPAAPLSAQHDKVAGTVEKLDFVRVGGRLNGVGIAALQAADRRVPIVVVNDRAGAGDRAVVEQRVIANVETVGGRVDRAGGRERDRTLAQVREGLGAERDGTAGRIGLRNGDRSGRDHIIRGGGGPHQLERAEVGRGRRGARDLRVIWTI